jgi:flagellar basal-body rod protein FlgB
VSQIYFLQLASQQAKWLSARQTIVASNISNADTPGYKAMDIAPFTDVLNKTQIAMATTNPMDLAPENADFSSAREVESDSWDTTVSGNSVNLEQELIKEGDINRSYQMNTSLKRVFNQMLLATLK